MTSEKLMEKTINLSILQLSWPRFPCSFRRWEFDTSKSNSTMEENLFLALCSTLTITRAQHIEHWCIQNMYSFWKKTRNIFANDIQSFYDLAY